MGRPMNSSGTYLTGLDRGRCNRRAVVAFVASLPWLPFLDTYRTMCVAPHPEFQGMLQRVRELGLT
jgi:hypothetical protein